MNNLGNDKLISEDVEMESDEDNRQFKVIISEILLFILTCLKEEDDDIKAEALKVNDLLQKKIIDILRNTAHTNSEMTEGGDEEGTEKAATNTIFPQIFNYL